MAKIAALGRAYSVVAANKWLKFIQKYERRKYWRSEVRSLTPKQFPPLTTDEKRSIDEQFKPYFCPDYATHRYLKGITGEFHPDWIPYDEHYCIIDPFFNDWSKSGFFSNKCFTKRFFGLSDDEIPVTVCYRANGIWYDGDNHPISESTAISIASDNNEGFIKAATGSCGGRGVTHYSTAVSGINQTGVNR